MILRVKVVPKSSRDRIAGWVGDRLKVAVTAPPERGRANEAVARLLAKSLGIAGSRVRIVSGQRGPLKEVEIQGVDTVSVSEILGSP